ncbi:glutamate 5-kinase [Sandaracinomonas limnophila]|uniref:Glutamate 5-kinase n=1 Tax=Sandaracinomonas limnophila TaxID=1862386 RepID=A0A437PMY1_9BACT|nr:glutamate 5-kinase [Sandaracinomonas limnophila]RVU23434.1 glutamate 5-kinase [Sandaracinomonas limnophila]
MAKPIVVIKFGSSTITKSSGEVNEEILEKIAAQVSALHKQYDIVLVSSGAVAAGKSFLKKYKGQIQERKAAAAIGNPILIAKYNQYFQKYGIAIAQSLCERHHFSQREQFLQLKETYQELWKSGVIPIANENDVVSNVELKFSDNDELATLIATGFGASKLLISTSVGGLLDQNGKIIRKVDAINDAVLTVVNTDKSSTGLGGMISKLTFTNLATKLGIKVVIFGLDHGNGILDAIDEKIGTVFEAQEASLSARQKWLAAGSLIAGKVVLDSGAEKAILHRKSLLSVGVKEFIGEFAKGEVIEFLNLEKNLIAIARTSNSSQELIKNGGEVAHADDIVVV